VIGHDQGKAADQLTQIITGTVTDPPAFTVEQLVLDGKPLQLVRVEPSAPEARPHLVNHRTLVRAGATNRPATPREIAAMTAHPADLAPLLPHSGHADS